MRKSRFTEEQIVAIMKEGEAGVPVAELPRRHGLNRATYFNCRAKYAGTTVAELRRLKDLEAENGKLRPVCTRGVHSSLASVGWFWFVHDGEQRIEFTLGQPRANDVAFHDRFERVSQTVPSWNQLLAWLREMDLLRRAEAA